VKILQNENFQINILTSRSVIALDSVFVTYSLEMLISSESMQCCGVSTNVCTHLPNALQGRKPEAQTECVTRKLYNYITMLPGTGAPHKNKFKVLKL